MDKPLYQKKPIGSVESLARLLNVDTNELINVADNADSFYYLHERKRKADGSFRDVYGVKDELKYLQKQITKKIYNNVHFPVYLQGSIKDPDTPRSHIIAASSHTNASLVVRADISNFFPSLTSMVIFDIWKRFFHFPEQVGEVLTKLTTFNGSLPQGAPTSPGLANLAFWDIEHTIVDNLQKQDFTYTRFVDDVTVSSKKHIEMLELAPIFKQIFGMFRKKGVKPNRNKIHILTSDYPLLIHNLNINSGVPTIPKDERSRIRAAVGDCENNYQKHNLSENYEKLWASTSGRVNFLSQLHPTEAQKLRQRLQAVKPPV